MRHDKKALPAERVLSPVLQRKEVDTVSTRQEMMLSYPEASVALQHEVTKRQRVEAALRESEIRFT